MFDNFSTLLQHKDLLIPFYALATGRGAQTPVITRLIETAIMSVVAAAFGVYLTGKINERDIVELKHTDVEIKQELREGVKSINERIDSLYARPNTTSRR